MKPPRSLSFPLWPGRAPGARGTATADRPTLVYFRPAKARPRGAAMVILPGGGYRFLAPHEGAGYARWLARNGYHAFVLNYRLGSRGYRHPVMLTDAARAIRLVRYHAARWRIAPNRVGIIGSSAGGHLAALLATLRTGETLKVDDPGERENPRPDLAVLCYPVITMGAWAHADSRAALLGSRSPLRLRRQVSAEFRVTRRTPPCFIWHTVADDAVPVENSLLFASALRRQRVSFELHLYAEGGHGLGLGRNHPWAQACLRWLDRQFPTGRIRRPA